MQEELNQVEKKLKSTQVQLTKKCTQQLKLFNELHSINKENSRLRKQLADGVASIASMANVANYRPREIGSKNNSSGSILWHLHYRNRPSTINFVWIELFF